MEFKISRNQGTACGFQGYVGTISGDYTSAFGIAYGLVRKAPIILLRQNSQASNARNRKPKTTGNRDTAPNFVPARMRQSFTIL